MRLSVSLLLLLALAVTDTVAQDTTSASVVVDEQEDSLANATRLDQAYELLYRNSEVAQDRLVDTVQWSIGLVLAILLAVIGSQIFFQLQTQQRGARQY